jgi:glyoxylate/hydroxypyruvate reductase
VTDFLYSSNPASAPAEARDGALVDRHKLSTLKRVDVDQLAQHSDVVFVLAPGGEKTKHLVNESFLKRMKRSSILVNASRGTLVDSEALALALREGWIWGAGLDVVEGEPDITADHPLVKEPRCVGLLLAVLCVIIIPPNRCVIVPHIGSATLETRVAMATLAVQNVLAGVSNEPLVASVNLGG